MQDLGTPDLRARAGQTLELWIHDQRLLYNQGTQIWSFLPRSKHVPSIIVAFAVAAVRAIENLASVKRTSPDEWDTALSEAVDINSTMKEFLDLKGIKRYISLQQPQKLNLVRESWEVESDALDRLKSTWVDQKGLDVLIAAAFGSSAALAFFTVANVAVPTNYSPLRSRCTARLVGQHDAGEYRFLYLSQQLLIDFC